MGQIDTAKNLQQSQLWRTEAIEHFQKRGLMEKD